MNWKLIDKYEEFDPGVSSGATRDVELYINTDEVIANLNAMAKVLDDNHKQLLKGFDLSGAWSSDNSGKVVQSVAAINTSFSEMATIIESLQTKVNSYVSNVVAADTVNINGLPGEGEGSPNSGVTVAGGNQNMTQ